MRAGAQQQGGCRGSCACPSLRCSGSGPTGAQSDPLDLPQVGDFAILLRAGFDRWSAAKLQLSTALGGLLGACFAICTQSPKGVGMGGVCGGGRWPSAEGSQPRAHRLHPDIEPGSCPRSPLREG